MSGIAIARHRSQRGVALVVSLVFLLALTLIGVASLSTNTIEARMSYSFGDYNRAFQNAESAIAEGERWLDRQTVKPIASTGCNVPRVCSSADLVWDAQLIDPVGNWFAFDWSAGGREYGYDYPQTGVPIALLNHDLKRTATVPRYVIEELGKDSGGSLVSGSGPVYSRYYYRVTAIGTGAQDSTRTVVQSVYVRPY